MIDIQTALQRQHAENCGREWFKENALRVALVSANSHQPVSFAVRQAAEDEAKTRYRTDNLSRLLFVEGAIGAFSNCIIDGGRRK